MRHRGLRRVSQGDKAEYEHIRADARRFIRFREHLSLDADEIISEGDRFTVVAKREGEPAENRPTNRPPRVAGATPTGLPCGASSLRSMSRSIPTSTARSDRSSSQSIRSSAKVRLCGLLQNSPIRS